MKLKESKFCCTFAWNPRDSQSNNLLLAAASIDGVMDDNFSSEAHLEIRRVNLSDTSSNELPVVGRVVMPDRAHRIHWSAHGGQNGIIAAGLTDGTVKVWSADRMLETYDGSTDEPSAINNDPFGVNSNPTPRTETEPADPDAATLCTIKEAHPGGVKGLHFNPVKNEYLATGGSDRELAIWSLANPSEPTRLSVIAKATHVAEITDIRWHVQVERIIGTTTTLGTFSLWDLRTGKQTQQIQGQMGAATTLAWHPLGATEVAIARDSSNPVVQIWDLKKANAPVKELRGHTAGITGLGWCPDDSNLLFSSGCDGRTICWNPITGELVGELTRQNNWVTDVTWCPRVPAIVATSSFDNSLAVHAAQDVSGTNATGTATLPKAVPKWLVRPCSASFGFGGRIVRLAKDPSGGQTTLEIITKTPEVPKADSEFRQQFETMRADPQWIAAQGHADIAAVATSNFAGNREAVLGFLGVPPDAVLEAVKNATEGFGAEEKEVDELLARSIACGRLTEAVNLCISANRYDDAFAAAFLQGTAEVTRVHQAYLAHKATTARFASYISAVATKDLTELKASVLEKRAPWREALAVLASFLAPQQFAAAANDLGASLESTNPDAAASCYICAGSVDAVARLWSKQKTTSALIHSTQILESVTKTQCRDKTFIDALASYADQLAKGGDYKGALSYAVRAADLGSLEGAVVADLCQSMVAPSERLNVKFPFAPIQIPDSNNPFVKQIAAMQQPVQRRVDPQPAHQQGGMGGQSQQRFGGQNPHMPPNQHPYHQHPGMQAQQNFGNNQNQPFNNNGPNVMHNNNNNIAANNMPPHPNNTFNNNLNTMTSNRQPMPVPNVGGAYPSHQNMPPPGPNPGAYGNNAPPPGPGGNAFNPHAAAGPTNPMGGNNMPPPANNHYAGPHAANNSGALPRSGTPSAPIGHTPTSYGPPPPNPLGSPQPSNNFGPRTASGGPPPPPGAPHPSVGAPPPPTGSGPAAPMPPSAPNMAKGPSSPYGNLPPPPPNAFPAPSTTMPPPPTAHHQPPTNTAPVPPSAPTPTHTPAAVNQPQPSAFATSAYAAPTSPLTAQQQRLATSGSSSVIFTYAVESIPSAEGQQIATAIITATNKITDKRKRDSVEKAALELLGRLTRNEVSAPCVQLLLGFVAALGTPASKEAWRKLSDAHFAEIGPYLNLKFL